MSWRHIFVVIAAITSSYHSLQADEAKIAAGVENLVTVGWATSSDAKTAADQQYQALKQLAAADSRIDYAYALVQLKQRRLNEAATQLKGLSRDKQLGFQALRTKAWLSMLLKDYQPALVESQQLADLFPKEEFNGAPEAPYEECAAMLGRFFGYLEGPAGGAVADSILTSARNRVLDRLGDGRRRAFEDGRSKVLLKFTELTTEKEKTKDDNIAAATDQAEKTKQDIEKQKSEIASQVERLEKRVESSRAEFDSAMQGFDREEAPLIPVLSRLNDQLGRLQREGQSIRFQANDLRRQAERENDPVRKDRLLRQARDVERLLFNVNRDLDTVEREGSIVQGQRARIIQNRAAAQNRWQTEQNRIKAEANALKKSGVRIAGIEKRLDQPVSGNNTKTRVLSLQATAFTTYDQFPLDAEKERLLGMFR